MEAGLAVLAVLLVLAGTGLLISGIRRSSRIRRPRLRERQDNEPLGKRIMERYEQIRDKP